MKPATQRRPGGARRASAAAFVVGTVAALGTVVGASAAVVQPRAAGPPDVSVKVLPSASESWVGRGVVFNVLVSNVGGEDAAEVSVETVVGGGAGVAVQVVPTAGTCALQPTRLVCSLDTLARAATAKIRIAVRPTLPGTIEVASRASAARDAGGTNDAAAATTRVRPGQPGPPTVRVGKAPVGALPDARDETVARVRGRVDVTEPGRLTMQVVARRSAATIPILARSSIGPTKTSVRRRTLVVPVGGPGTATISHLDFDLRLPLAKLRVKRVYAIVLRVVDLEGEQGKTLQVPFRLVESPTRDR